MPPKPSIRGEYIETETGNKISRRASILGPKHIILAGKCVIQNDVVIHGDLVRPAAAAASSSSHHTRTASTAATTTDPKSSDATAAAAAASSSSAPTKPTDPAAQPQNQTSIHLGRHVYLSPSVVLHPPSRLHTPSSNTPAHQVTTFYPMTIASHVYIGANTVVRAAEIRSHVWIGANVVVGNMVIIKDNVKILDGSVLPPSSVWCSGSVVAGRPARVVGSVGEGWGWGSDAVAGAGGKASATSAGMSGGDAEGSVGARVRERWALVGSGARKGCELEGGGFDKDCQS